MKLIKIILKWKEQEVLPMDNPCSLIHVNVVAPSAFHIKIHKLSTDLKVIIITFSILVKFLLQMLENNKIWQLLAVTKLQNHIKNKLNPRYVLKKEIQKILVKQQRMGNRVNLIPWKNVSRMWIHKKKLRVMSTVNITFLINRHQFKLIKLPKSRKNHTKKGKEESKSPSRIRRSSLFRLSRGKMLF